MFYSNFIFGLILSKIISMDSIKTGHVDTEVNFLHTELYQTLAYIKYYTNLHIVIILLETLGIYNYEE
jgi:hypothetical protein